MILSCNCQRNFHHGSTPESLTRLLTESLQISTNTCNEMNKHHHGYENLPAVSIASQSLKRVDTVRFTRPTSDRASCASQKSLCALSSRIAEYRLLVRLNRVRQDGRQMPDTIANLKSHGFHNNYGRLEPNLSMMMKYPANILVVLLLSIDFRMAEKDLPTGGL